MIVKRISMFTGEINSMEIPITPEQLVLIENRGQELIQNVAPQLSPALREFLMTGVTPQEWDAEFGNKTDIME